MARHKVGVINSILVNVCLHELDVFMADICQRTQKGKRRKVTPEYKRIDNEKCKVRKFLDMLKEKNLEVVLERGKGDYTAFKYA